MVFKWKMLGMRMRVGVQEELRVLLSFNQKQNENLLEKTNKTLELR